MMVLSAHGGFSIIQGDTLDAAVDLAKRCVVQIVGGSVEVGPPTLFGLTNRTKHDERNGAGQSHHSHAFGPGGDEFLGVYRFLDALLKERNENA